MKTLFVLCSLVVLVALLCTQTVEAKKKHKVKNVDDVGSVRKQKLKQQADEIVKGGKQQSKRDRKGNSLKKGSEKRERGGGKSVRLQQQYNGIDVYGYGVVSHETEGGYVYLIDKETRGRTKRVWLQREEYMTGKFVDDLGGDLGRVSPRDMHRKKHQIFRKVKAKNDKKNKKRNHRGKRAAEGLGSLESSEPIIYVEEDTDQPARAAYLIKTLQVSATGPPSYLHTITDEQGETIKEWDGLNTYMRRALRRKRDVYSARGLGPGGNQKTGKFVYGSTRPKLEIGRDTRTGSCVLQNANVRTVHMENSWSMRKSTAYSFPCYTQDGDETNGAYSPLNDAHYYANQVFQMYDDWYETSPVKTRPITVKVHYGQNFDGAMFIGGSLYFGDGGANFYPMVSLDVMAHEISHGVTEESSVLIYSGESGGLSESFSDMAGKSAERFARGYSRVKWGLADDVAKRTPMRCMENPKCDGKSIDHVRDFKTGMDVHYSSGVFNKVFHLMSVALPYNLWDSFDIFYIANTKFWQSSTNFIQGAELVFKTVDEMKAGKHTYDYGYLNIEIIQNAFKKVGIDCVKAAKWTCTKMA